MESNKTLMAKDWIRNLANGINPLDGTIIPDGDIVNNVHISRCLFYVAELLDRPAKKCKSPKDYEFEFNISPEDLAKVNIVERTGIANFTREINKLIPENMRPISYNKILNWLMVNGYLEEREIENVKRKTPTAAGYAAGISAELRDGKNGPYWAVEYNSDAQRFILNNIYSIIEA